MAAYYNEIDPYAAQWLRNLIGGGHIAPGDVDERSIEDVRPEDIRGYTQCHFFAGVGVWAYALRRAGWTDDRPVWTGSCPCQPFSAAGKGAGFDDERHLWPAWYHLISECKPPIILGEQVASKDADAWIDLVQDDMEALGYPFGAVPFPSAGVGAPHIRDRTYWVADSYATRLQVRGRYGRKPGSPQRRRNDDAGSSISSGLEHPVLIGRQWGKTPTSRDINDGATPQRPQGQHGACIANTYWISENAAGPTNGYWRAADWLGCRDGKFRPVEPGTFPLAHGATARVGRLRAYGNAINAEQAKIFIETVMEII
ncbi:DNA-cytosine methyltransferase [Collimonas arenae]|uniref:DNA-cytosine methyltransferase n=1 Tax=Collimonas arenae TaxID=279058 RepID=A0A0A1F6J8_9BURK|nr:DNA cytosine methyltransferase [Collimonas arenae]AIY40151.1 DNA-cytosine methyltransferase [Collimonas arenae]